MSEVNIIKVDGKPLEKLVEVISRAIGTLYKPRSIRKQADAEAYKIEIIERAKSKAIAEGNEIEADTFIRIQDRLIHREKARQINIDNVAQIAAEQLSTEENVSEEQVADDWTTRFFNIVEDISDEELQGLWGRILAGEVKQPKSFSLRTLELLKNLSKDEADVFTKLAKYALSTDDKYFIIDPDKGKFLEEEFKIKFIDRLLLNDIGLIASKENLEVSFKPTGENEQINILYYGTKGFFIKREKQTPKQAMQVILFSKPGTELLKLVQSEHNENYIKSIATTFKSDKSSVKYGDIIPLGENQVSMINPKDY